LHVQPNCFFVVAARDADVAKMEPHLRHVRVTFADVGEHLEGGVELAVQR
jgi:hypothetical protein